MKRARLRKRNLTAQTSTPVLAQPGESLSLFLNMSNEIKVGDTVRVAKDAPRMYISGHCRFFYGVESVVEEIEDGNAIIRRDDGSVNKAVAIPTKYLVKVDAEAKEAKFKYQVGQKVILHFYGGEVSTITEAFRDGGVWNKYKVKALPHHIWNENELDPYAEPTEQTEAEKTDSDNFKKAAEEWANTVSKAIKEYGDAACKIIIDANNEAFWDSYTANLAKEVVLKVANKFNTPHEAAEYAVSVAKAVVEGLKNK